MKTKHTKGEWILKVKNEWPFHQWIESLEGYTIAECGLWGYSTKDNTINDALKRYPINKEPIANAKLIAAAPELLESLIEIRKWYEENQTKILKDYTPVCFSKALSVIKKATQ